MSTAIFLSKFGIHKVINARKVISEVIGNYYGYYQNYQNLML